MSDLAASDHPAPATRTASGDTHHVGLGRIGQIAVPVGDLARAVMFYREVLGMRFLFETPTLAFFDADGVRLMLTVPTGPDAGDDGTGDQGEEPADGPSEAAHAAESGGTGPAVADEPDRWALYFPVKSLERALASFTGRGAHLERDAQHVAALPDHDLWMAFIRDSEGNLLGLMEERPR